MFNWTGKKVKHEINFLIEIFNLQLLGPFIKLKDAQLFHKVSDIQNRIMFSL